MTSELLHTVSLEGVDPVVDSMLERATILDKDGLRRERLARPPKFATSIKSKKKGGKKKGGQRGY